MRAQTRYAVKALGVFQRNINGGILWVGGLYLRGPPLDAVDDLMASA
ncbi:hypothetical protein [uncultured Brevibacterium sp.]|nr:hypothetical protein [uncultured Brevibacterium sp.]